MLLLVMLVKISEESINGKLSGASNKDVGLNHLNIA